MPKKLDGKKTAIFASLSFSLTLVSLSGGTFFVMPSALAQTYTDSQGRAITKDEYDAGQMVNEASQLLNQNKNAEALFRLERAVQIAPNLPDAHYNYGIALAKMGQTEEAVKQYQEASRLNPQMPYAWMNLGASYQMLGKIEEAVQAYTEFVTRFPSNPEAGKLRNLIQGLNKEMGRQTNLPPARPQQAQQSPQSLPPQQPSPPQQLPPQQAQQQGNNFQPINPNNNFQPIGDGSQGFAAPQKPKTDWSKGNSSTSSSSPPVQPGLSDWQGGSDSGTGNSSGATGSLGLSGWQGTDSGSGGANPGGSQNNFQPIGKSGGGSQGNFQPIGKTNGSPGNFQPIGRPVGSQVPSQGGGFQPLGNVKTAGGGFQPIGSVGAQGNFQPIGNAASQGNFQPIGNSNSGAQGNFQPIANASSQPVDPNRFAPPDEQSGQPYAPPAQMQQAPPQQVQRPSQPPATRPAQVAAASPHQKPAAVQPAGGPRPQSTTDSGAAASNYLNDVGGARLGRWPASRMPLKVCIIPAANVKGYQPAFDQCLIKCFQDWGNASGGKISFKGVSDQKSADIVCTWTSDTSKFMNSAEAGETTVYGSTAGIQHATMLILTVPHPMSPTLPLSENRLRWICLHEIGHALGLGGHTKNPQDIMFFSTPLAEIWKELTARDANTIQALYSK